MKRTFLWLAVLLLAPVLFFSGCGGSPGDDPVDDPVEPFSLDNPGGPASPQPGKTGVMTEIFKIGDYAEFNKAGWEYDFESVKYLDLVVIEEDLSAIQIGFNPDINNREGGHEMQINLTKPVDISEFGLIDLEFYTNKEWDEADSIDFVVTLIVNSGGSGQLFDARYRNVSATDIVPGVNTLHIGENLWFQNKDVVAIAVKTTNSTDDYDIFITKLELKGTSIEEPDLSLATIVPATNIRLVGEKGAAGGTGTLAIATLPSEYGRSNHRKMYIYFENPRPGEDYYVFDIDFARTGSDGANVYVNSVITKNGDEWFDDETDKNGYGGFYIGWLGWGNTVGKVIGTDADPIPYMVRPADQYTNPIGHTTAKLNEKEINCITLELEMSGGATSIGSVAIRFYYPNN